MKNPFISFIVLLIDQLLFNLWFCKFPMTNGSFLEFLKIRAKWKPSELACKFSDFTCFRPFLT